jgi:hypothetical protein
MPSIRHLKRDINFLTEEVIGTCLLHYHIQNPGEEKRKEMDQIVEEIVDLRNEVIIKINKADTVAQGKSRKAYLNELFDQVLVKVNDSFDRLNKANS